jgi:hypothetical protein
VSKQKQLLDRFIKISLPDLDKSKNLMGTLVDLQAQIEKRLVFYSDLTALFEKHGTGDIFLTCPCCDSSTLLELKQCPLCGETLMEDTSLTEKNEAEKKVKEAAEPTKKKAAKKATKKAAKKAEPEPEEVIEEEVEESLPEEEADAPDFPSEDEVNKMDVKALRKTVKDFSLDVNEKKQGLKTVVELRDAVNAAIEKECEEGEEADAVGAPTEETETEALPEEEETETEALPEEEDSLPSADEVNKMKAPELKALIKKEELEVDLKTIKKLGELRTAVNEALDALDSEPEEEGIEEGTEEEPNSEEVDKAADEFDVEGMGFDDIDEDIDTDID